MKDPPDPDPPPDRILNTNEMSVEETNVSSSRKRRIDISNTIEIKQKKNLDKNATITESQSSTVISRKSYSTVDKGPYVIHVQRIEISPSSGSTIHPIIFGKFLKNFQFKNIVEGSLKKIGRNKISLTFSNYLDANDFITNKILCENSYNAFIPTFSVTRMGIVRGIPHDWSPEEIVEHISIPSGIGPVLKARRLNYKTMVDGSPIWKPSQTVVITFDGQILPQKVFLLYNSLPVEMYHYPTIQCFLCCRFGHTKNLCRSKPRCYKCGDSHTGDSCDINIDSACCFYCTGNHFATNRSCPEQYRQKNIKITMAEKNISYSEAAKVHKPTKQPSYADALSYGNSRLATSTPTNLSPPPQMNKSYKKTFFAKPRNPPSPTKGYDRNAHQALINDFKIPEPISGCALNRPNSDITHFSISELLITLINLLTSSLSQSSSPSHVASLLTPLISHLIDGSDPSMELQ